MQTGAPKCLSCIYFKGRPTGAKDKAKCAVKSRGIPNSIYFEGKKCIQYSPRVRK